MRRLFGSVVSLAALFGSIFSLFAIGQPFAYAAGSPADHFEVTIKQNVQVGEYVDLTVKAIGKDGKVKSNYVGTIYLSIDNDTSATLPEPDGYTFVPGDKWAKLFPKGTAFTKAGKMKLSVFDVDDDSVEGFATVNVSAARASSIKTSSNSTSNAASIVQKVYKVEMHSKDLLLGSFDKVAHGSAVLIGKNRIITNAHVILWEDKKPTGMYNLCVSTSAETTPKCVSALKLLQYDETNDLALLEPVENISLGAPVPSTSRKLELGEAIRVYGYPANGGETITFTEGKVSGFDDGHYKVDANIDAGNSGGGAFDKNGKLIGIPYSASVGYSTLGYVIPMSMVQSFLSGEGDVTKYGKFDADFASAIRAKNAVLGKQVIQNQFVTLSNFSNVGFVLDDFTSIPGVGHFQYNLSSKTGKTNVQVSGHQRFGNQKNESGYDLKELQQQFKVVKVKENLVFAGKKIEKMVILSGQKSEDGTVDDNALMIAFGIGDISYIIQTDSYRSEKKYVSAALGLFLRSFSIRPAQSASSQELRAEWLNVPLTPNTTLIRAQGNTNTFELIFDSPTFHQWVFAIESELMATWSDLTLEETAMQNGKYLRMSTDNKWSVEVRKNSKGNYYLRMRSVAQTGEKKWNSSYVDVFATIRDGYQYTVSAGIYISKNDPKLLAAYEGFVDSISLEGKLAFSSAKVGVVFDDISSGSGQTTSTGMSSVSP